MNKAISMNACVCPVCHGRGNVPTGFYRSVGSDTFSSGGGLELCRSCSGKGWVKG
jgi:hypothetical protein